MFLHFETTRLILRSFEDRDAQAFADYRSDPEVARYQGWEAPYSLARAIQFVEEMKASQPGAPGQWHQLAMELKDTGQLAGDCAFQVLKEDARQAEIGISLARAYQGQGYATESLTRLLDYLFSDLHMHRVRANIDPQNTASAHLLERLGLRHEGRFIQSLWLKGEWCDEDWYAILRKEWKKS